MCREIVAVCLLAGACIVSLAQDACCGALDDALVGHWAFDEGAGDTAGDGVSSNHGALTNGPVWAVGHLGGALSFDGVDDFVQLSQTLTLPDDHTVCMWVRVPKVGQANLTAGERVGVMLGNFSSSPNCNWEIYNAGEIRMWWNNGEINQQGSKDLRDDQWHHVAYVRDTGAATIRTYVDGQPEFATAGAGTNVSFNSLHRFGGDNRSADGGPNFHGLLGDVRIYGLALSPAEIEALASEGTYSGGAGTEANPWRIGSAEELLYLAGRPGDYGKCFVLTADIDLSGRVFTAAVIGPDTTQAASYAGHAFTGQFMGNGFSISNLTIDTGGVGYSYLGLFGRLGPGAVVRDVALEDVSITQTAWSKCVGALAGDTTKGCIVEKCEVVNGTINAPSKVGLLVGECGGLVQRCHVQGTVAGHTACGGLIGNLAGDEDPYDSNDNIVEQSSSTGQISGMAQVGGLVGAVLQFSKISLCASSMQVNCGDNAQKVGGLVGEMIGGFVVDCRATGNVSAGANARKVGGLIGQSMPGISYPGIVMLTYCRNTVTYGVGGSEIGGYAGSNLGSVFYYNYYLTPADWGLINGIATPLTDAQLRVQGNFENFDFANTWLMQVYPILAWEQRVGLEELGDLARYWMMSGCTGGQACAAADWYVDSIIDERDLVRLAENWLRFGMDVRYPTFADGFETGDFTLLAWEHGGDLPWVIMAGTVFEGSFAAQSGPIGDSESSELRLMVYTPATYGVSFQIKGSTQYTAGDDKDSLMWYIDGNTFGDFYGEFEWTEVTSTLHEGVHTLRWVYSKNAAGSGGQDCLWIDNLRIEKLP